MSCQGWMEQSQIVGAQLPAGKVLKTAELFSFQEAEPPFRKQSVRVCVHHNRTELDNYCHLKNDLNMTRNIIA